MPKDKKWWKIYIGGVCIGRAKIPEGASDKRARLLTFNSLLKRAPCYWKHANLDELRVVRA